MPDQPTAPARPWRVIAAEITHEQDPQKMAVLLLELNRALDEQELKPRKSPEPDGHGASQA